MKTILFGVALTGLSVLACARPSPELPERFASTKTDASRISEFRLLDVWQARHPDYTEPLKVLVSEKRQRGFVNHEIAFFRRGDGFYSRIGQPLILGGYDRPVFGTDPELHLPSVVVKTTGVDEWTYVFVHDGSVRSRSSAEDEWIDADRNPLIEVRDGLR